MPLRDHFHPSIANRFHWEGLLGGWPMKMVRQLCHLLPANDTAEPRVRLGTPFEFNDSVTQRIETDLPEQYEYEVLVYDTHRERRLVAAIEIVSPANKDRPENRRAFVAKCATLLQKGVSLSIIDLVTIRNFNLYADLLALIDQVDPAFAPESSPIYAVTCRGRTVNRKPRVESWAYPLEIGTPLPNLPIWLSEDLGVSLELEASYEETCHALRIP